VLAGIAALLVVVVVLLIALARKRVKTAPAPAEAAAPAATAGTAGMTATAAPADDAEVVTVDFTRPDQRLRLAGSFRRALRDLRRHLRTSDYRYRLPWVLLVGETASGKSGLLAKSGLDLPLGPPADATPEEGAGCSWWLLERGVVLDVAGDFVLAPDGRGSSRRGFNLLLRALRAARPERPLDAFVLAVPCAGLLGADATALTHKAALLSQKLRDAQRQLGMVIPVYVMVTGCERVPGFVSLFREVPERAYGEIFGWSSPYAPDTPFRPDWVDEGFEAVHAGVRKAQLQILGERLQIDEPDGVFVFPHEMQALREPLRTFLAAMFKPSTFSEPLGLRGFYFSGELPTAVLTGESAPRPAAELGWGTPEPRALFVRDLFETKIFAERGLAHAAAGTLASRGRLVLATQIGLLAFVLVAGLGTWWARDRLAERKHGVAVFLEQTDKQVRAARREQRPAPAVVNGCADLYQAEEDPVLTERAFGLMEGLRTFDGRTFRSPFLPSSWLGRFDHEVKQFIGIAYDRLVFEALESGLRHSAREVIFARRAVARVTEPGQPEDLSAPVPVSAEDASFGGEDGFGGERSLGRPENAVSTPSGPPTETPAADLRELADLRAYVEAARQLEADVNVYNGLDKTADLRGLVSLLDHLYARTVPEDFFKKSELYREALTSVRYPKLELHCWHGEAETTATGLADWLDDRLDQGNAVVAELRRLDGGLQRVSQARGDLSPAELRALSDQVVRLDRALALPQLAWLHAADYQPRPALQTVLSQVRGSALLGPGTEKEIRDHGKQKWAQLVAVLGAPYTIGTLLERDAAGARWLLSPNLVTLRTALADLQSEPFMSSRSSNRFQATIPPGEDLYWNVGQLTDAVGLYKPYESFKEGGASRFPDRLRQPLLRAALERLSLNMVQKIGEAQTFRAAPRVDDELLEQGIRARVKNLDEANPPLNDLIANFQRIGKTREGDALADLVAAQGCGLLRSIDRLVRVEAPYTPKGGGFAWWQGGKPVSVEAYDVPDLAGLGAYLEAQRSRLALIAEQYAQPALRLLGDRTCPDPGLWTVAKKWQGIDSELRKYEAKKPGNSLASLETFLEHDIAAVDARNCLQELGVRRGSDGGGDFFLQTRSALRRQLYQRCQDITQQQALAGYRQIERYFNQRLAGRFPFADGVPGRLDREADPEDVRTFFKVFDARAPIVLALPDGDPQFGDEEREIRDFLGRMGKVRLLFAQFLDDPLRPDVPTFGLDLEFRTNRKSESGGNQVIRWELQSGRQRFERGGTDSQGSWTLGDKVGLVLQWAKDARTVPLAPSPPEPGQPHLRIEERKAVYEYAGRWSLFALLREYASRPGDFAGAADPRPQTLRLAVDTGPAPLKPEGEEDGGKGKPVPLPAPTDRTVVFVRVTLTSLEKDKRQDLELPAFPSRAPTLPRGPDELPGETARGGAS
jgi:type VI secretion system protein ImpL